jgi:hypothetical protein
MDLTDRMIEHDLWLTNRLLDAAGELQREDLARPVPTPTEPRHAWFEDGDPTLRTMLDRLVYSKEMWTASLAGRDQPERGGASIEEHASGTTERARSSPRPCAGSATATSGTQPSSTPSAIRRRRSRSGGWSRTSSHGRRTGVW